MGSNSKKAAGRVLESLEHNESPQPWQETESPLNGVAK